MTKKFNGFIGLIYASVLPNLQEMARKMGYALTIHGSMKRDFDLVAIPWFDTEVKPAEELIAAIAEISEFHPDVSVDGPTLKPHGRRAWSITLSCGLYFDVSVMPRDDDVAARYRCNICGGLVQFDGTPPTLGAKPGPGRRKKKPD